MWSTKEILDIFLSVHKKSELDLTFLMKMALYLILEKEKPERITPAAVFTLSVQKRVVFFFPGLQVKKTAFDLGDESKSNLHL